MVTMHHDISVLSYQSYRLKNISCCQNGIDSFSQSSRGNAVKFSGEIYHTIYDTVVIYYIHFTINKSWSRACYTRVLGTVVCLACMHHVKFNTNLPVPDIPRWKTVAKSSYSVPASCGIKKIRSELEERLWGHHRALCGSLFVHEWTLLLFCAISNTTVKLL